MSPFFAALFQAAEAAPQVGTGVRETFRLLDAPATWIVVLVVLPACALLA